MIRPRCETSGVSNLRISDFFESQSWRFCDIFNLMVGRKLLVDSLHFFEWNDVVSGKKRFFLLFGWRMGNSFILDGNCRTNPPRLGWFV